MRMHLIYSPEEMKSLNASSKMNADWDFFQHLHKIGYEAADKWLKENWANIGKKSTLDIHDKFLCGSVKKNLKGSADKNTHMIEMLNKKAKPDKNK